MRIRGIPLVVAIAVLAVCPRLHAQQINVGSINGSVTDSTGGIIPGAAVVTVSTATNLAYPTVTTSAGLYTISQLPVGMYSVTVSKVGFEKETRSGVEVIAGTTFTIDFVLRVGSVSQTLTVTGAPPLLNSTDTHQGTTRSVQELQDLPIDLEGSAALSALDVVQTLPGVDFYSQMGGGWITVSRSYINGIEGFFGYEIDGIEAAPGEPEDGEDFITPVPDQIQEVRLTTNTDASEGFNGGVAIDMVTKSGSNKVHGDVYYYVRNGALEARNFFLPQVQKDDQNEGGLTLGGPVYIPKVYDGRNRTFFFGSMDVYRFVTTQSSGAAVDTVPTAAEQAGNFSALLGPLIGTDGLGRPIYQGEIYDPATTRQLADGSYIRDPFTYGGQLNVVPPSALSAISKNFASNYSAPTGPGIVNNWIGAASPTDVFKNQWSLKIDHTIGERHHLTFSSERQFSTGITTFPGNGTLQNPGCEAGHVNIQGYGGYTNALIANGADEDCRNEYRYRFHYSAILNAHLLFDFRAGVTRDPHRNQIVLPLAAYNEGCAAGLTGTLFCFVPNVSIENVSGFGNSNGNSTAGSQRTPFSASLQWVKGKHQLAFGVDYVSEPYDFAGTLNAGGNSQAGAFSFTHLETSLPGQFTNNTGAGIASYYIGQVDNGSVYSGVQGRLSTSEAALYAQDKWRVNNKLTLDYGLRWELTVPPTVDGNQIGDFNPSIPNPGAGGRLGAISFYGIGAGRNGLKQFDAYYLKAFAPKLGLSYAFSPKTVFRSNFGISYFPYLEKWVNSQDVSTPHDGFALTRTSSSTNSGITPAFNWQQGFPLKFPALPDLDPTIDNNNAIYSFVNPTDNRPEMVENIGAEIERELPGQMTLSVGYVGTLGHRLYANYNLDSLPLQYLSLGSLLDDNITSPQAVAAGIPLPYPGYTGTVAQALTPYPQYLSITDRLDQLGTSSYNSLQMSLQRHFGSLTLLAAFTASKFLTMTDANGPGPQNGALKAQSIYQVNSARSFGQAFGQSGDIPKQLNLSWYWSVPVGRGKHFLSHTSKLVDELVGNWRLSGIQYYQAGLPLFLTTNESVPGLNIYNGSVWPVLNKGVPIKVASCDHLQPGVSGKDTYLSSAAFSDPAPFHLGNDGNLSTVRACGYYDENIGLEKGFPFGEGRRIGLGVIGANLFNRHQLLGLTTDVDSPGFGQFTSAGDPRTVQLYMKVIF